MKTTGYGRATARAALALATTVALGACATGMSEEDCRLGNWYAIGEQDGAFGEPAVRFDERADQCREFGVAPDLDSYFRGRERGLLSYCTPDGGFEAGRAGRSYAGVCPPESEADFLAEYDIGRRIFALTAAVEQATNAYESAVSAIDQNRYSLRRARERLRDPDLTEEQRAGLERDIDRYRRDIERAEYELPRLRSDIRRAEGELEDYRAFIGRRSRGY